MTSSSSSSPSTADPSSAATSPPPLIIPPPHPSSCHPRRRCSPSSSSSAASSAPILGIDTFLTFQYSRDPTASNDSFSSLTPSLKSALSSSHDQGDHRHLISSILSLFVFVYVVIVGFALPKASSSLIFAFSSDFHTLSLSHSPQLHVSHALPSLAAFLVEPFSLSLS